MLIHAMISCIWTTLAFCIATCHLPYQHHSWLQWASPTEIFTGVKNISKNLLDFHPFGCPILVLDPSLQQGHKIPCWKPCSRVGVYLRLSPNYASSIPLVLSTTTGLGSPQFHVVYDDLFTTTTTFLQTIALPDTWSTLLSTSSYKYVDDDFSSSNFIDPIWFHDEPMSSPIPTSESSLSQKEDTSTSLSTSQREDISTPLSTFQRKVAPPSTRAGWNPSHQYDTRFH